MAIPKPNTGGQKGDNLLPQVPASNMIAPPRVDFDKGRFDTLVAQKGVDVSVEKALQCPCSTNSVNPLPSCRNCGGTGWVFVNKRYSRLVMQSMDFQNKEEVWSKIVHGVVKITAPAEESFSYMDRVTRLNANSIFSESIQFSLNSNTNNYYSFTSYEPKSIEFLGIFVTVDEKLTNVSLNDIVVTNSRIELKNSVPLPYIDVSNPLTATIRYVHAPVFHIIEHNREVVDNYKWNGKGETLQYLPTLALARRAHDIQEMVNLKQGRLFDNSYNDGSNCDDGNIYKPIICK